MLRRPAGYLSMEALALISALCIAAILFYAHYARQAQAHDQEARRLAMQARPAVEAFFTQEPQGKLSLEGLKAQGFEVPAGLMAKVTPFKELKDDWQLELWHPEGQRVYLLGPGGIGDQPR